MSVRTISVIILALGCGLCATLGVNVLVSKACPIANDRDKACRGYKGRGAARQDALAGHGRDQAMAEDHDPRRRDGEPGGC
jgi:hypothetical protein